MYMYMVEKVGRVFLFCVLVRIIDDCVVDLRCNLGKDIVYIVVGGRCGLYCIDLWIVNLD